MPLQTQYMQVDFSGGLDQKTDQRVVIPGNFTRVDNCVYTKTGSLRKRPGNEPLVRTLVNPGTLPEIRSIYGYQDALLAFGDDYLYALNDAETHWDQVSTVPEPVVTTSAVNSTSIQVKELTSCTAANGVTVYVYVDSGNVYSTATDANGIILLDNEKVNKVPTTCIHPMVCIVGTKAYALYADTTTSNLWQSVLDLTFPTTGWTAETPFITNLGNKGYDAVTLSDRFVVVYQKNSGGAAQVVVSSYNGPGPTPVDTNATIVDPNYQSLQFAIAGDISKNSIWVAYIGDAPLIPNVIKAFSLTSSLTVVTPLFTVYTDVLLSKIIRVGVQLAPLGNAIVIWQDNQVITSSPLLTYPRIQAILVSSAGTIVPVGATPKLLYSNLLLVGKPFLILDKVYALVKDLQDFTYFLVDFYADDLTGLKHPRPVATMSVYNGISGGDLTQPLPLAAFTKVSGTEVSFAALSQANQVEFISDYKATFKHAFAFAESNASLISTGGIPSSFDESRLVEIGFLVRPKIISTSVATGGTLAAGQYVYYVTYEWTDAKGQTFRSAPSDAFTAANVAANGLVTLTIGYLSLTNIQLQTDLAINSVQVVIYRSATPGSTAYKRLLPFDFAITNPQNINQVVAAVFTYTDSGSNDSTINTRPLLYTALELPNVPPPSATIATLHNGRLWLAGTDDPTAIWPSKFLLDGEPPGFANALVFNIHEGGPITGLASLDDKLIVFKENKIFAVYGDGKNNLGVGTNFAIQRIAADTGCVSPPSVVITRQGVMYQAPIGISLLSRALEVAYIGNPVEDTVDASLLGVMTAVNHPTEPWVTFTLGPDKDGTSAAVVYDYFQQKWARWFFADLTGLSLAQFVQSATLYKNAYTWITTQGVPYRQTFASYMDAGFYYQMDIETAWLKFAGIMGYQRVRKVALLGDIFTPNSCIISFAHNYNPSGYTQSNTYDSADLLLPSEQFGSTVVDQKCSSLRIRVQDAPGRNLPGTGQAFSVSGFGLEVGAKEGLFKLPTIQGG